MTSAFASSQTNATLAPPTLLATALVSGKSAMLGVAREAWEAQGYTVRRAALSGIAAENLEQGSGIASRTIASLEHQWARGRDQLGAGDVLIIDEAGMIGSRQMERLATAAAEAGAKLVLVGDAQQLQAIEAGAAFRLLTERHGAREISAVRRQHEEWQRDATRDLATSRTGEALARYDRAGMVHAAETREAAAGALIERWKDARDSSPAQSHKSQLDWYPQRLTYSGHEFVATIRDGEVWGKPA